MLLLLVVGNGADDKLYIVDEMDSNERGGRERARIMISLQHEGNGPNKQKTEF